jgi:hypothetical protein
VQRLTIFQILHHLEQPVGHALRELFHEFVGAQLQICNVVCSPTSRTLPFETPNTPSTLFVPTVHTLDTQPHTDTIIFPKQTGYECNIRMDGPYGSWHMCVTLDVCVCIIFTADSVHHRCTHMHFAAPAHFLHALCKI